MKGSYVKNKPFEGAVKIGPNSGLRKLARAMRRGMVPDERQVIIDTAMKNAAKRLAAAAAEREALR
jgi:hypothetical protein